MVILYLVSPSWSLYPPPSLSHPDCLYIFNFPHEYIMKTKKLSISIPHCASPLLPQSCIDSLFSFPPSSCSSASLCKLQPIHPLTTHTLGEFTSSSDESCEAITRQRPLFQGSGWLTSLRCSHFVNTTMCPGLLQQDWRVWTWTQILCTRRLSVEL